MEAPAIMSGLFIANKATPDSKIKNTKKLTREIFTNGAILLLSGAYPENCVISV